MNGGTGIDDGKCKKGSASIFCFFCCVAVAVVCFDFKRKQTNSIGFLSFVCSSFNCFRSACVHFCFILLAISCAQRVLNFNKYVHFDSVPFYKNCLLFSSLFTFTFLSVFFFFSFVSVYFLALLFAAEIVVFVVVAVSFLHIFCFHERSQQSN